MENELIPIREVLDHADSLFAKEALEEAAKYLREWLDKARKIKDPFGELGILNELMGLYRRTNDMQPALEAVYDGFELVERLNIDGSVTAGTTWLNGATTLKAFGNSWQAITYYKRARRIYETRLERSDYRISGLYNNMALCLVDLKQYAEAESLYHEALDVLFSSDRDGNLCDIAATYMNLAYLYEEWDRSELIDASLERCELALKSNRTARNGYYAFTCRKCVPGFAHFGWFAAEKKFDDIANSIYDNNKNA
ncbi:MAG: tetratricopeptide repeat protein [Christensenellaceae bacterium]|nr:tetratricopeptide repeat protein [Christensenellaceae bacterium]